MLTTIDRRKALLNHVECLKSSGAFLKGSQWSQNYIKNGKFTHNSTKIDEIEIQHKIKALLISNWFWDKLGRFWSALSHKAPTESICKRQKTLEMRRAPLASWWNLEKMSTFDQNSVKLDYGPLHKALLARTCQNTSGYSPRASVNHNWPSESITEPFWVSWELGRPFEWIKRVSKLPQKREIYA